MSVNNASFLPLIGKALNTAERASLQCSIPLLSARFNGAPAEFWGKVCGYKNDYLIAQVLPVGPLGPRVSFYSTDGGNNWTVLEDLTKEQAAFCEELRGVYQGVPDFEYKKRKDIPAVVEPSIELPESDDVLKAAKEALEAAKANGDDESDEEAEDEEGSEEMDEEDELDEEDVEEPIKKDRKPKFMIVSITEARRLSHFVQLHDACCRLAVRGEYVLSPESSTDAAGIRDVVCPALRGAVKNRAFGGQPLHNATKPSCYVKLFAAGDTARNALLYGPTYNPHTDYLSPITDDAPQGVWSVKYDASLNAVAVANLLFEGSLFWYRPNTVERGQVYYGSGERNFELFFML